jgi:hypothetical protein
MINFASKRQRVFRVVTLYLNAPDKSRKKPTSLILRSDLLSAWWFMNLSGSCICLNDDFQCRVEILSGNTRHRLTGL